MHKYTSNKVLFKKHKDTPIFIRSSTAASMEHPLSHFIVGVVEVKRKIITFKTRTWNGETWSHAQLSATNNKNWEELSAEEVAKIPIKDAPLDVRRRLRDFVEPKPSLKRTRPPATIEVDYAKAEEKQLQPFTNNTIFNYGGINITFQLGDGTVMVNATEMAKPFGKRPSKWLELPSAKQFLQSLTDVRELDYGQLVVARTGGVDGGGTLFHEDAAIEFARWLAPQFGIWCNDRIKELLTSGSTSISTQPTTGDKMTAEELLKDPKFAIKVFTELATKDARIKELSGYEAHTISEIAAELGLGAPKLNAWLVSKGFQYNKNGRHFLRMLYTDQGYELERPVNKRTNKKFMVFTEKGRKFILDLVARSSDPPNRKPRKKLGYSENRKRKQRQRLDLSDVRIPNKESEKLEVYIRPAFDDQ
ncbi:MAG TPA: KilA-N domain-containing protein [Candidatus Nanoarchaeia archaeon]|nr:KilA-N domain-containing protein [Candidatus Nanoarchaeia archaeon]